PTARGVPIVPERAALISTAHDEAPLRLAPYRALFQLPRAFGFLTPEERDLVHRTFRNEHIPHETIGLGLDAPGAYDVAAFRAAYELEGPLVLYLGQVSQGKGCDELLAAWAAHRADPRARPAAPAASAPRWVASSRGAKRWARQAAPGWSANPRGRRSMRAWRSSSR